VALNYDYGHDVHLDATWQGIAAYMVSSRAALAPASVSRRCGWPFSTV
jgi:hypothetical protein